MRPDSRGLRPLGTLTLVLFLSVVCSSRSFCECVDYASYVHWVNTIDFPGWPVNVAIDGNHAYVAADEGVLWTSPIPAPRGFGPLSGIYASDVAASDRTIRR
jgi:hypothetical protein